MHQNHQCVRACDWTGDHRVMVEASTDILIVYMRIFFSLSIVTLMSLIVRKFVMFCNSEIHTITLPISLILVFGSWHPCIGDPSDIDLSSHDPTI